MSALLRFCVCSLICVSALHFESRLPPGTDTPNSKLSDLGCDNTCEKSKIGIEQSLSTIPRRTLSEKEMRDLDRDGVILLRSVITNQRVMKQIADEFWKVNTTDGLAAWTAFEARKSHTEKWNAGTMALLEDELLTG